MPTPASCSARAEVTARHDQELAAARQAHRLAAAAREAAVEAGRKLAARRDERRRELERARAAEQRAARAAARVEHAEQAIKVAGDEVVARQAELERLGDPGFDADAHQRAKNAAEALHAARRRHDDLERALAAARARHEEVAELEERAAYLARLVDLMAAFRLHLVARLGRRVSVEAAELFAELTDHEYQDLVVDPEDYSIRIADQGTEYELARYSG